ncbi:MAG: hypothetical protein ACRCU5_12105 [Rhizobiaceae bacterium]
MRFLTYLIRFILISLGFIVAVLASSAFLMLMLWGGIAQGDANHQEVQNVLLSVGTSVLAAFVGYYAFFPAILVFMFAEITGRRSWLFHSIGGIVIALAAIARRADANNFANPPQGIIMAVIAAGAVGGTVYWLFAGRSAGKHLDEIAATSPSEES